MNYLINDFEYTTVASIVSEPELRQYEGNESKTASITLSDKYGNKLKEVCIDVPDAYCTTQDVIREWVFRTLGITVPIPIESSIIQSYNVINLTI